MLPDKTLFMIFFDKSTRTRNAFEAGMTQLGGHAHDLTPDVMQISHGESPKDTGIILSRYGHGIAIRHDLEPGAGDTYIREVAKYADVPVINLQSDVDHPTQTIADLMTIREKFPEGLRGLKIAVSWAYAPSYAKPMSVPQGLDLAHDALRHERHDWPIPPSTRSCITSWRCQAQCRGPAASLPIVNDMDARSTVQISSTPRVGASKSCSRGRRRRLRSRPDTRTGSATSGA